MADERVLVGDLTRKEFRERMQAGTIKAAIVPTAATEQHNEHLEMTHDTLHCSLVAQLAAQRLLPQVVVAPTVAVGVSGHVEQHQIGGFEIGVGAPSAKWCHRGHNHLGIGRL